MSDTNVDELIEHWNRMEQEALNGTGDMYFDMYLAELAHHSAQALRELQDRIKKLEKQLKTLKFGETPQ